ncbi:MAG TPA: sigma-70 factor domain-containing protein, partial [Streptosporangiaceae bacterium]
MPRNATARREPEVADEAAITRVDELIQLGRGQGYLSLTELRAAFGEAGVSPAEGRSIIRELAEAGVRLGDEPGAGTAPEGTGTAPKRARTGTEDMTTAQLTAPRNATEEPALDSLDAEAEAEAVALAEDSPAGRPAKVTPEPAQPVLAEVDLDDQTSVMGDSVHTYLKSIGRTSLLTAEQEVNLAKRIEAGLFAEHKLATEP